MNNSLRNHGVDIDKILTVREEIKQDPSKADRNKSLTAEWIGRFRSKIKFADTGQEVCLGGKDEPNAMQMLLATLAACDVDLIAMHASRLGLEIESLSVAVSGHYNITSYVGIESTEGSGYDRISYTIHVAVPRATSEQIAYLRERCSRSSPVGDSLSRAIPLHLNLAIEREQPAISSRDD